MAGARLGSLLRYLRGMVHPKGAGLQTDAQLLERFLTDRDEAAFEALVQRHGPMVLGVGRTVLGDTHAAEDVFQATFLVLARKAQAVRRRESLGGWLYGVAYRVALNARASAARRRKHERRSATMLPGEETLSPESSRELQPAVAEELDRLPEKYRAPLVLCYFQGLTNDQAAEQLQWPTGTVRGRLARAREVLRDRLARRGVTLSAVAIAALLTPPGFASTVPGPLLSSTVKAAVPVAFGEATVASVASGPVAELTHSILRQALVRKLAAIALVGAVCGLAGGAGLWLSRPADSPQVAVAIEDRFAPQLLATFQAEKHYAGHPLPIAFSADGKRLAVLAQREAEASELILQDIATGARIEAVKIGDGFHGLSGDSKHVILLHGGEQPTEMQAEVRDLTKLKVIRTVKDDKAPVQAAETFLSGDTLIVVGARTDDGGNMALPLPGNGVGGIGGFPAGGFPLFGPGPLAVALHDLRGQRKAVVHDLPEGSTVQAVQVFGQTKAFLLLKVEEESRMEVLDLATGKSKKLADNLTATALTASANGQAVALQTSESTIQLWDVAAEKAGRLIADGDNTIICFALAPDGRLLATAGSDRTVKLWDVASGKLLRELAQPRVQQLLFAADGRLLASASADLVKVWKLHD